VRDGEVVVSIVDHGPGLTAAERESVFEPFTRGQAGDAPGSGLGLAIARGFAVLNGARLWVDSAPGRGATFSLALPVAEIDATVPA
jgi:two-component system sensor histidine kinase KdpD